MEKPSPPASLMLPGNSALWSEPLDTSGLIPHHLKRAATTQFPILEVLRRLLYRMQLSGGGLEKILSLIGLYEAVRPVSRHLKDLLAWAFTVQVTIPETDPVAKDVLAWMGSQVISDSYTHSAMLVTGGVQDSNDDFHRRMVRLHKYGSVILNFLRIEFNSVGRHVCV